jgi:DNA-directed RNA polymerase subunit F
MTSSLQVIEKIPMNVVQVKEALEKIKGSEEGLELNFRAAKTMEYAEDFAKIKPKAAKELLEAIQALEVPRLKDMHIHKIIDLMPQSEKSVKVILGSYHLTVTGENVKKIADLVVEHTDLKKQH